jgi:predicted  nucleic acid-binding Zn-ribbon protein
MGILQQIRTKLGVGSEMPDSAALTQALGDLNARINQNRADAAAIEASIPGAVIASIDGAATERRKLERLESEHTALVKTATATRREIAEALAREKAAELDGKWERAERLGDELKEAGVEFRAAYDALISAARKVLAVNDRFVESVPVKAPDWSPQIFADGVAFFTERLASHVLLERVVTEQVAMGFKARPSTQQPKQSGATAA